MCAASLDDDGKVPHELGHLMGLNHTWNVVNGQTVASTGVYSYGRGHQIDQGNANNGYRTIMSERRNGATPQADCCAVRLMQYSSPLVDFMGHPGIASGTSSRDAARALRDIDGFVSQYRTTNWIGPSSSTATVTSGADVSHFGNGQYVIVAKGSSNQLLQWTWTAAGGLSAVIDRGGVLSSAPRISIRSTGVIDVVALDVASNVILATLTSGGLSSWQSLGGPMASAPDIAAWSTTRRDVVARDANGYVNHKYWDNGAWSGWSPIATKTFASAPSITTWGVGRLDIVARDAAGTIWHAYNDNGAPFGPWDSLGFTAVGAPIIHADWPGSFTVITIRSDNTVWEKSWLNPGYTSWSQITAPIGTGGLVGCGLSGDAVGRSLVACTNPNGGINQLRRYRRGFL